MNQFFYTRKEPIKPKAEDAAGAELKFEEYVDSFNITKIIRTVAMDDGRRLILLDDIHERVEEVPTVNKKRQVTGTKRQRGTFQTEIYLSVEDSERFIKTYNNEVA